MAMTPSRSRPAAGVFPAAQEPARASPSSKPPPPLPKGSASGAERTRAGIPRAPSSRDPRPGGGGHRRPWRRSEAVAAPVTEGRLRELHDAGPGLVEELGGAAQQPLGLRERLRQLLLPLHELGVALRGKGKRREDGTAAPAVPTDVGIAGNAPSLPSPPRPNGCTLDSSAPCGSAAVGPAQTPSRLLAGDGEP